MRILIGYDGREGARDAAELARQLAALEGGSATLAYVIAGGWPATRRYEEVQTDRVAGASELLAAGAAALADVPAEARVFVGGSPARVLTELAERDDFDLLVVGSPHRGAIGRALVGSVAERLLHGASCATVVAPRGYATERHEAPRLVAVAYDGSPEAKLALHRAETAARAASASLRVLTVEEPLAVVPGVAGYTPPPPTEPKELLAEARSAVPADIEVDGRALAGPVAETLAEACEDGVDLLVVGSRGYGPLGRVLLGSVSTAILHKAPCPVLVVPRSTAGTGAVERVGALATERA